jgi:hypothetical protein
MVTADTSDSLSDPGSQTTSGESTFSGLAFLFFMETTYKCTRRMLSINIKKICILPKKISSFC